MIPPTTVRTSHAMSRTPTTAELCHDRLGDRFQKALSDYDTRRRVDILIDEFLSDDQLCGKRVLDVGCGLGFFSQRLVERGADVLACDIGAGLVSRTRSRVGCHAEVADALMLADHFGPEQFDVVVSSECIEHTPDPTRALEQMMAVLRPGGHLSVSTPNRLWSPVVRLATALKLRPFDGHECFSSWSSLERTLRLQGGDILRRRGLHLWPFQIPFHGLSRWCDDHLQVLRGGMINLCVLARKRPTAD